MDKLADAAEAAAEAYRRRALGLVVYINAQEDLLRESRLRELHNELLGRTQNAQALLALRYQEAVYRKLCDTRADLLHKSLALKDKACLLRSWLASVRHAYSPRR